MHENLSTERRAAGIASLVVLAVFAAGCAPQQLTADDSLELPASDRGSESAAGVAPPGKPGEVPPGPAQTDPAGPPADLWGSAELIDVFQYAGVPAGATHLISPEALGDLPQIPREAHRFDIVIWGICMPCRGRVYAFGSAAEAGEAFRYLFSLAATDLTEFGRVYTHDNLVVLIDRAVPDRWADGYRDALQLLGR